MLNVRSSRALRAVVLITSVVPVVACVDARNRFEAFDDRVVKVDADTTDSPMVDQIPNIDGVWLVAVNPSVAPGSYVQIAVTWDVTSNGATGELDGSYQPLTTFGLPPDSQGRTPVGAAIIANDAAVDNTATFTARLVGILPGPANPVSGNEFDIDIMLTGTIRSETFVCGTVAGMVGPLNVAGSTFAAIPMADPIPAPVAMCPPTGMDAGIDAAP